MRIADDYGRRIGTNNIKRSALERLLIGYPSHDFAIDRDEAKELFHRVREPDEIEQKILQLLKPVMTDIMGNVLPFLFVDDIWKGDDDELQGDDDDERQPDGEARSGLEGRQPTNGDTPGEARARAAAVKRSAPERVE